MSKTFVIKALYNSFSYPLAVFGGYGYRLLVEGFDHPPRFVVPFADLESHSTSCMAVGEDVLQVGDGL